MLERECRDAGVTLRLGTQVTAIRRDTSSFEVSTSASELRSEALIIATGGPSIPKMGATGFGYEVAKSFGMSLIEPRPALVPMLLAGEEHAGWSDLSGLSAEVVATAGFARRRGEFREKLLITHRGVSGPAVLQISSYWREGETMTFDLAPGREVFSKLLQIRGFRDRAMVMAALREMLPQRFAERWVERNFGDASNRGLEELERRLHAWQLTPVGTEGYAKAEVTLGGVDTCGLEAKTMESRTVPRLYFIGEVVDVTGWLGGYNFQWAWASGVAAGRAV